jgi:F-box/leucine-rich repeat protein 10/11
MVNRKMKESTADRGTVNGDFFSRDSMQTPSRAGGSRGSTEFHDTMMYSPQDPDECFDEKSIPIDPALQYYHDERETINDPVPSYEPHRETIMSSIEDHADDAMEDVIEMRPHEYKVPTVEPRTPGPPPHIPQHHPQLSNGINHDPSSPLSPLAPSIMSSGSRKLTIVQNHMNSTASRVGSSGRKPSNTPRPTKTPKKSTPGSGGRRRDSKESINQEPGAMGHMMPDNGKPEDVASLALAIQLQMEEHGLRRRSK